jgi:integrase
MRHAGSFVGIGNRVWKETDALFPSRQSDRMTDRSVRNVVTKAAELASVRPYRIEGGRGEPSEVSPHTFRHSITFRMIRRENKRLEDVNLYGTRGYKPLMRSTATSVDDRPGVGCDNRCSLL